MGASLFRYLLLRSTHWAQVSASFAPEKATSPAREPFLPSVPCQVRSTGPSELMEGPAGLQQRFRTLSRYFTLCPNWTLYAFGNFGLKRIFFHIVGGTASTTSVPWIGFPEFAKTVTL